MAEAYGRLTGNPAGCLGTLGPGASNLVTGVADANMDRAPMLVLTGQGATTRLHKESHQVMDVVSMFEPITKWAVSIRDADTIPEIVRKAVRLARLEKPGAVHLELPEDIAKRDACERPIPPRRFRRAVPDPEIVEHAWSLIRQARRPVILAGNGCVRKRASHNLREFCDLTGIGVISTFMAKGCVDMDADYCLYTAGLGTKDIPNLAIDDADLVIALGFDMVEYHPHLWNPHRDKRIVHADFLPAEIDRFYHPEVELVGDLANVLGQLTERVREDGSVEFDVARQRGVRARMQAELAEFSDDDTEGSVRPQKAVWDARQVLHHDDVLLSDVGAHKMWVARHFHCHDPNTCLIPNGYCSMGFALPGAIAANLVFPNRRVLAIAGDGGFLMNVQEMESGGAPRQQHRGPGLGRQRFRAHLLEAAARVQSPHGAVVRQSRLGRTREVFRLARPYLRGERRSCRHPRDRVRRTWAQPRRDARGLPRKPAYRRLGLTAERALTRTGRTLSPCPRRRAVRGLTQAPRRADGDPRNPWSGA